jgi:hypothetical protein
MKVYLVFPTHFATQSRENARATIRLSQISLDSVTWDTDKRVARKMIFVIQPHSFNVGMGSAFVQEIMKQVMMRTLAHAESLLGGLALKTLVLKSAFQGRTVVKLLVQTT